MPVVLMGLASLPFWVKQRRILSHSVLSVLVVAPFVGFKRPRGDNELNWWHVEFRIPLRRTPYSCSGVCRPRILSDKLALGFNLRVSDLLFVRVHLHLMFESCAHVLGLDLFAARLQSHFAAFLRFRKVGTRLQPAGVGPS